MKVYFNSQDPLFKDPFGAVTPRSTITFRIETADVDGVVLRTWTDKHGENRIEMHRDGNYFYCEAEAPDEPCLFWYFFLIYHDGKMSYYGNNEAELGGVGRITDFEPPSFQITVYKPMHTPDWFKNSIVYYIFPDRFHKGRDFEERKAAAEKPGWKGPGRVYEEDWYKRPQYEKNEDGTIKNWHFYGGTLEGIIEKLPYISTFGVTTLYLCPIFESGSSHRYDTGDYMKIDPLLGTEETFKRLCAKAAEHRISVVLDGVFSHTGCDSIYFDKYGNYNKGGAYGNPDSKYYPWYTFHEDGTYESWWGDQNLPNVIEEEPFHKEFICGKDGVLNKWLDLGAKGWRLDVADELPDPFIRAIRRTIKSRPDGDDVILLGEVWEDASNKVSYNTKREFILGEELDAPMNYPFRKDILDFLLYNCSAQDFCARIMSIVENYPKEVLLAMINMLGSHDRVRPLTALSIGNNVPEELQYDYYLQGIDKELAKKRLKLASILQYILPGVPVIYYGDEAGLEGHADPYNRAGYPWGKEEEDIIEHYRLLGKIYRDHPALRTGNVRIYPLGDDVVAIERYNDKEKLIGYINRNWKNSVVVSIDTKDSETATGLYKGEDLEITGDFTLLRIEATDARIIFVE